MILLLILAVIAAVYLARHYRDKRDRLATEVVVMRLERQHSQLDAERGVWRQVAAVQQATRQAMHDVVDSQPPPERRDSTRRNGDGREGESASRRRPCPVAVSVAAETVERVVRGASR